MQHHRSKRRIGFMLLGIMAAVLIGGGGWVMLRDIPLQQQHVEKELPAAPFLSAPVTPDAAPQG
jgi:hypothetical protein